MPHTKFQGHRSFGSREEDFLRFLPYNGHGGHLGHMTWTVWTNFHSSIPRRLHVKFCFNRPCGFREEAVWKCWHTYTHTYIYTYPRTTEAYLQYKLTYEPKGSGELTSHALIGLASFWKNVPKEKVPHIEKFVAVNHKHSFESLNC